MIKSFLRKIRPFWILVLVLVSLLVAVFFFFFCSGTSLEEIFGPADLFAEILGVLIVVLIVDQMMFWDRRYAERRYRYVAYKGVAKPIRKLVDLFQTMTKATLPPGGNFSNLPVKYSEFFEKRELWSNIQLLDMEKNAPILPRRSWRKFIAGTTLEVQDGIKEIIDRYLPYLDDASVELLESVRGSNQLFLFRHLAAMPSIDKEIGAPARDNLLLLYSEEAIEKLFQDLIVLFNLIKKHTNDDVDLDETQIHWTDGPAPRIGEGRLSIETMEKLGVTQKSD